MRWPNGGNNDYSVGNKISGTTRAGAPQVNASAVFMTPSDAHVVDFLVCNVTCREESIEELGVFGPGR